MVFDFGKTNGAIVFTVVDNLYTNFATNLDQPFFRPLPLVANSILLFYKLIILYDYNYNFKTICQSVVWCCLELQTAHHPLQPLRLSLSTMVLLGSQ